MELDDDGFKRKKKPKGGFKLFWFLLILSSAIFLSLEGGILLRQSIPDFINDEPPHDVGFDARRNAKAPPIMDLNNQ